MLNILQKEMRRAKMMRFCALQMKSVHQRFRQLVMNLHGDEDLEKLIENMPLLLTEWWSEEPCDQSDYDTMYALYDDLVPSETLIREKVKVAR